MTTEEFHKKIRRVVDKAAQEYGFAHLLVR
jgi:hypothetical protein